MGSNASYKRLYRQSGGCMRASVCCIMVAGGYMGAIWGLTGLVRARAEEGE